MRHKLLLVLTWCVVSGCSSGSELLPVRDGQPSWSPDGQQIAFVSNRSGSWQIWLRSLQDDSDRQITTMDAPVGGPSWNREGTDLLFYAGDSLGYALYRANVGQARSDLFLESNEADYFRPNLSRDGRLLLMDRAVNGNHDVVVRNMESGAIDQLAPHAGYDSDARWSPGDSLVVFHSDRDGSGPYDTRVYTVRADGTGLVAVSPIGETASYPTWCPDGDWVAFSMNSSIYAYRRSDAKLVRLTDTDGNDSSPAWSPDGGKLVFSRDHDDGTTDLVFLDTPFCLP